MTRTCDKCGNMITIRFPAAFNDQTLFRVFKEFERISDRYEQFRAEGGLNNDN